MAFTNGSEFKLSAEFLRINSPAVDGKIRSIGGEKVLVATFGILYQLHHLKIICWTFISQTGFCSIKLI